MFRRGPSALLACRVILVVAFASMPVRAWAYVRVLSSTGKPYAWPSNCVAFTAYPRPLFGLTPNQFGAAVIAAAQTWSQRDPALAACTSLAMNVSLAAPADVVPSAAFDHVNVVIAVTNSWSHEPAALAVTGVFANSAGQILDTDVEINAVDFSWADLVSMPGPGAAGAGDLQNALTHEMGHAIGLGHTCSSDPSQPRPVDQDGLPIPDCATASAAVRQTTMFPSSDLRDVSKRTLSPDDQRAVCDIYPLAAASPSCGPAAIDAATIDAAETGADASSDADDGRAQPSGQGGGCGCATASVASSGEARNVFGVALALFLAMIVRSRHRRWPRPATRTGRPSTESL